MGKTGCLGSTYAVAQSYSNTSQSLERLPRISIIGNFCVKGATFTHKAKNIKIPGELSSATILRVRFRGMNSENANDFDVGMLSVALLKASAWLAGSPPAPEPRQTHFEAEIDFKRGISSSPHAP